MFAEIYCSACGDAAPGPIFQISSVRLVQSEYRVGVEVNGNWTALEHLYVADAIDAPLFANAALASGCGADVAAVAPPGPKVNVRSSAEEVIRSIVSDIEERAMVALPPIDLYLHIMNPRQVAVANKGAAPVAVAEFLARLGAMDSVDEQVYAQVSQETRRALSAEGVGATVAHGVLGVTGGLATLCDPHRSVVPLHPGQYQLIQVRVHDPMAVARQNRGDFLTGLGATIGLDIAGMVRKEVVDRFCTVLSRNGVQAAVLQ